MKENIISNTINYLQENWRSMISKIFLGMVVFIILYIIIKYIVKRVRIKIEWDSLVNDVYAKRSSKLVGKILFILLMIFNILATFQIIGFDVAIIMWGISLSIWFAMETTIGNLISGVFILTNKKIKLGDFVEFLGSLKIKGTIEEVNVRYTVIKSFDGRRTIIPNSVVAKTPIRTLKSEPLLKWEIDITIPRNTPFDLVKQIFSQIIQNNKDVLYPEYSSIIIENFNTSGIFVKWYFFTNPAQKTPTILWRDIKWELFNQLKKHGIVIPYNHTTITTE